MVQIGAVGKVGEKMAKKESKQITKAFYQHKETGQIVVIEKRSDGAIVGSCPATEPLKDLGSYECKSDNNLWVQENGDRLILL